MLGAILGDIIGSRFERKNTKSKDFELFTKQNRPTDDSIMTMAVAKTLFDNRADFSNLQKVSSDTVQNMQTFGRMDLYAGYGSHFIQWLLTDTPAPYNSFGNGAGMRVSPVGFAAQNKEQCKALSKAVTEVSHNHPEAIKGAEAVSMCVYLAKSGSTKKEIRSYVRQNYYPLDFTIDAIRSTYQFDVSCQGSVPQAIESFLESANFEDCIRTAISIGGDSDTIAAMAGAIAEAFYGVSTELSQKAKALCKPEMFQYIEKLEELYGK